MSHFLADIDFVESLWREALSGETGDARRFAEAHRRASFAISVDTSIRLLAAAGAHDEEAGNRFLEAFPVLPLDGAVLTRAASLFRTLDLPLETAIEGALATVHQLRILTGNPARYHLLPGITVVDFRPRPDEESAE